MFGADTEDNVLRNLSHDSLYSLLARVGVAVALICHYPIVFFGVRTNASSLFCSDKRWNAWWARMGSEREMIAM